MAEPLMDYISRLKKAMVAKGEAANGLVSSDDVAEIESFVDWGSIPSDSSPDSSPVAGPSPVPSLGSDFPLFDEPIFQGLADPAAGFGLLSPSDTCSTSIVSIDDASPSSSFVGSPAHELSLSPSPFIPSPILSPYELQLSPASVAPAPMALCGNKTDAVSGLQHNAMQPMQPLASDILPTIERLRAIVDNAGVAGIPISQLQQPKQPDPPAMIVSWSGPTSSSPSAQPLTTNLPSLIPVFRKTEAALSPGPDIPPRSKVGRKRKPRPTDPEQIEAEKIAKRAKNTEAARRSRLRKVLKMEELEAHCRELEGERDQALEKVEALEEEVEDGRVAMEGLKRDLEGWKERCVKLETLLKDAGIEY